MDIFFLYLLCINFFTIVIYGIDKIRAVKQSRRVPERRLIALALLGGSPGALLAMCLFRHKTRKNKFRLGVPFIMFIQLTFIILKYYAGL